MNALQTALSATTISGYVDTSIEWTDNDYSVPMTHPQVPTNRLAAVPNWGKDILLYYVRTGFTNVGIQAGASAVVEIKSQRLGESTQKLFLLRLNQLAPTNTYTLLSQKLGVTGYTETAQFTTDARGSAQVRYKEALNASGQVVAQGSAWLPLPDGIRDVTALAAVAVVNDQGQLALVTDLTKPGRLLHFARKRMAGGYAAAGQIQLLGAAKGSVMRLRALNLLPSNPYLLALNGTIVARVPSNSRGEMLLHTTLNPNASPMYLQGVGIGGTNLVGILRVELP